MKTLIVTDVPTGDVVDRVFLDDSGGLQYATGAAQAMFDSAGPALGLTPAQVFDLRTRWSNGYVRTSDAIDLDRLDTEVPPFPWLRGFVEGSVTASALGYNPGQRRGPDGKWIKGGGMATPPATRASFDGNARPGAATRLSSAEFERTVPPERRFYRGVHAREAAEHTRDGGIGNGDYGPGVYMDPRIGVAQGYARGDGVVMRMGLQPGTKVKPIPRRISLRGSAAVNEWATEGKFDAISTGNGLYVIVRNPDVLITDDRDYTVRESVVLDYLAKGYQLPDGYEGEVESLRRDGIIPDSVTAAADFRFDPGQPRDADGQWSDGGAPDVDVEDDDGTEGDGDQYDNVERFPSAYLQKYGHVVDEYPIGEGDLFIAKTDKDAFHVARGDNDRQVLIDLDDDKAGSLADFVLLFSENQPDYEIVDPISGARLRSLGDGGVRVEWPNGSASDLTEDGALFLQEGLRLLGPGFPDDDD